MRLIVAMLLLLPFVAGAQPVDQTTQEMRTVLYYHVPDSVLLKALPPGWAPLPFESGPQQGANLTVNISDQLSDITPDGHKSGDERGQGITISARVHGPDSTAPRIMVLWGFTNGVDHPGPYGRHRLAKIDMARITKGMGFHPPLISETWNAVTPAGDRFRLDLAFRRGVPVAGHSEQQTRSGEHPDFYRIYKIDAVSDVVKSATQKIDRLQRLTLRVAGGPATLLVAQKELVAVISIPYLKRDIALP